MKQGNSLLTRYLQELKLRKLQKNKFHNISSQRPTIIKNSNDPYFIIKTNQDIDEAVCDICLDSDADESDKLTICELCNTAVHQSCYGSSLDIIPEGNWYCQRCTFLNDNKTVNPKLIKCIFCPDLKGLINKIGENIWAHIVCVNWIPEIHFIDNMKQKLNNFNAINRERFLLRCSFCKIMEGCCIQCDEYDCTVSFHVKCARQEGLIGHWYDMEKYKKGDYISIKCLKHRKKIFQEPYFLKKKRAKNIDSTPPKCESGTQTTLKKRIIFKIDKRPKNNESNYEIKQHNSNLNSKNIPHKRISFRRIFKVLKEERSLRINEIPEEKSKIITNTINETSFPNKDLIFSTQNLNNDCFNTKMIPTQINFHNNTFNFGNSYIKRQNKLILDDEAEISMKLDNDILREKINFGKSIDNTTIQPIEIKNIETIIHKSNLNNQAENNINITKDFYEVNSKQIIYNNTNDEHKNVLKNENQINNPNDKQKIRLNNDHFICRSYSDTTELNSFSIDNTLTSEKDLLNLNNENKNYVNSIIENTISQVSNFFISNQNNEEKNINGKKKECLEKKFKSKEINNSLEKEKIHLNIIHNEKNEKIPINHGPNSYQFKVNSSKEKKCDSKKIDINVGKISEDSINKKFQINKDLLTFLKINKPISSEQLFYTFKNYLVENKLLENDEYILLFKNPKLRDIIKSDFVKLTEIKERLYNHDEENINNNLINEKEEKKYLSPRKEVINTRKSSNYNKINQKPVNCLLFKKDSNIVTKIKENSQDNDSLENSTINNYGWNLIQTNRIQINQKRIHRIDEVVRRSFFIKEESLSKVKL